VRGNGLRLSEIIDLFMVKSTKGDLEVEITGIQMDSRKIEKGNLFICVPGIEGFLDDRHDFARNAVKNGAVALIVERDVDMDVPKVFVNDAGTPCPLLLHIFMDILHMK
jgi:UDP-N-acetylmuramoyl-L-alanyl-D-glutamate--2,6-diaminopimelate ligase